MAAIDGKVRDRGPSMTTAITSFAEGVVARPRMYYTSNWRRTASAASDGGIATPSTGPGPIAASPSYNSSTAGGGSRGPADFEPGGPAIR